MAYIVDGNNVMGQTPGWHREQIKIPKMLLEKTGGAALRRADLKKEKGGPRVFGRFGL